ncbi:hypothetical protein SL054_002267 [Flavobacterium psychrophilum]|nr:hypothetical protein [Flavobacterium psychrophilum]
MDDYNKRFEVMKNYLNDTNQDIADITGLKMTSIKNQTQSNKPFPKWLKYTIDVFERMIKKQESSNETET